MKDDQIKAYLGFEENDLIANRNGELSEKQRKRIKEADRFAERFIQLLFVLFLAGGIFVGILAFSAEKDIALWIGMVLLLLLAGWAFRGAHTEVDDTVQKVEGQIDIVKIGNMTGSVNTASSQRMTVSGYEMRVGDAVFDNANPALIEYMQGDAYLVYFTKTTRQILSVEPISKEVNLQAGSESTTPIPS
jgi:hypothetical protein